MIVLLKKQIELKDEVSTKEIIEYFEDKYNTPGILSDTTFRRWRDELQIKHITSPPPKRNADIKYRKNDVLKMEQAKMKNLLRKREAYLNEKWLDKEASEQFEIFVKYQEQMEEQGHKNRNSLDSIGYQYEELMRDIIFKIKIEMCFEHLFPDVDFDEDALKNNLFVRDEYPYLKEGIEAREYIENRMFIIAKK